MAHPRVRRRARERAMQFLFGLDFTGYDWRSVVEAFWETNPSRPSVKRYGQRLIEGACTELAQLDSAIAGALHHWTPDRVGRVERAILRVALYEMRHVDDVPDVVAINEALELAKQYGSEETPRFVNGVLDRLKEGADNNEALP